MRSVLHAKLPATIWWSIQLAPSRPSPRFRTGLPHKISRVAPPTLHVDAPATPPPLPAQSMDLPEPASQDDWRGANWAPYLNVNLSSAPLLA
jgi:hypothetical protein